MLVAISNQKIGENNYNVIDGQQRLMSIFLILKYLGKNLFDIKYETREKSAEFLKNIMKTKKVKI